MTDLDPILVPRMPFTPLPMGHTGAAGVVASIRDGLGMATVLVKRAKARALAKRVAEKFHLELPQQLRRAGVGNYAFLGIGPETWLAVDEVSGNAFAVSLTEQIGDLASVSDQSDGYIVLRLWGRKVRDTLCKLVPLDLHPRAFAVGDAATTVAGHIGATLWRLEDSVDGAPMFEIAVSRSLAESFWRALSESAAEFGLETS